MVIPGVDGFTVDGCSTAGQLVRCDLVDKGEENFVASQVMGSGHGVTIQRMVASLETSRDLQWW